MQRGRNKRSKSIFVTFPLANSLYSICICICIWICISYLQQVYICHFSSAECTGGQRGLLVFRIGRFSHPTFWMQEENQRGKPFFQILSNCKKFSNFHISLGFFDFFWFFHPTFLDAVEKQRGKPFFQILSNCNSPETETLPAQILSTCWHILKLYY